MAFSKLELSTKKFREFQFGDKPNLGIHATLLSPVPGDVNGNVLIGFKWYITDLQTNEVFYEEKADQLRKFRFNTNIKIGTVMSETNANSLKKSRVYMVKGSAIIVLAFSIGSTSDFFNSPPIAATEPQYFSVVG